MALEIPVEDMIRLLCEHALVTEYATNPIGNLALRCFRTQLLELGELPLGSIEEFMRSCPESIVPMIVEIARKNLQPKLVQAYFADIGKEIFMKDKLICDYLQSKCDEYRLDRMIEEEEFAQNELTGVLNIRPL